jgi:E3 ubiquitin-protein ligase DOA10
MDNTIINIDEVSNENNDLIECMICIQNISYNDIVILPITNLSGCNCKGQYHKKCLEDWFIHKNDYTCPICLIKFNAYKEYNDNFVAMYNNYICFPTLVILSSVVFVISLWQYLKI